MTNAANSIICNYLRKVTCVGLFLRLVSLEDKKCQLKTEIRDLFRDSFHLFPADLLLLPYHPSQS